MRRRTCTMTNGGWTKRNEDLSSGSTLFCHRLTTTLRPRNRKVVAQKFQNLTALNLVIPNYSLMVCTLLRSALRERDLEISLFIRVISIQNVIQNIFKRVLMIYY